MSRRTKKSNGTAMLELWRPPQQAGDPIGCIATTYTFAPGLFDEQCLGRFLEIESEPNREDLAFLLERESRLGGIYAGVLVDHTQAGVEHSLRWDVLPVRLRAGKQHAKLSLLAWTQHLRIIVASANLTESGYRSNYEVAAAVELTPENANTAVLTEAIAFLQNLLLFVPGAEARPPEVQRAEEFLSRIDRQVQGWKPIPKRATTKQQLVFTLPAFDANRPARSSLDEVIQACRARGGSPNETWVASPFFDNDNDRDTSQVTTSLCKLMARGKRRVIRFCLPAFRNGEATAVPRIDAPKTLLLTPPVYQGSVSVELLPETDQDRNYRPWHAKMLAFFTRFYSALMIGSSNFTRAGMGVAQYRNAEANLLTIVDRVAFSREVGQLEAVWPEMETVTNPESAEWLGARPEREEEEQASISIVPAGFLTATYRAGDTRLILLRLDPAELPEQWAVHASGRNDRELLSASSWRDRNRPSMVECAWEPVLPPEKLLVRWAEHEAFLPLNVEDNRQLPPPAQLEHMSAEDMLCILAATDPGAAFRAWVKRKRLSELFDEDLDSAAPVDLDPLRHYDLQATFLHRIHRRARVLAQLRANLQRPVWSQQALEWRLWGMVGIEPLADRLLREVINTKSAADESLLILADFLIVLREVEYQPTDGAIPREAFENIFRSFLRVLANKLCQQIDIYKNRLSKDMLHFWDRVIKQCQE